MYSPGAETAAPGRRPGGYFRWLKVYGSAVRVLLGGGAGSAPRGMKVRLDALRNSLVLTQSDAQELLLAGFPALIAVPEALFPTLRETPGLAVFPRAASAEELLGAVRTLERMSGRRCDWDAILAACRRRNCRTDALLALAERIRILAGARLDTVSAQAALAALAEELADRKE